ncbi:MAG: CbtA family protein [Gammaproteobacteria bacterium]|nr:CbtA family protein [Gammaproteobacteria bacterium]
MLFRRIILNALLVGLVAGVLLSVLQFVAIDDIIIGAEQYEAAVEESAGPISQWEPDDGLQRTALTLVSNVFAGIGFSAVLLALMSQLQSQGIAKLNTFKGFLWGLAGYTAFFAAPGIGLPPEIPGVDAASLQQRQLWWLLAVICVGGGLLLLAFAKNKFKPLGGVSLFIPYLVGAPHHDGPAFSHADLAVIESLNALHHEFILASGLSNLVFWVVLGSACAWALNRWVLVDEYS